MVIHLGDWIEIVVLGKIHEVEIVGVDQSATFMDLAADVSNISGIREGTTELTKSQYTIYTNINEYDFAKNSIGKTILWVTSSNVKKVRDGMSKLRIDNGYVVLPPIKKDLQPHEIEELENKKRLIKFFFKDLQEPYIAPENGPFKYI
jgi:hypothetical protein